MQRRTLVGGALLAALAGCSPGEGVNLSSGGRGLGELKGPLLRLVISGEPDQLDPNKTSAYFSFQVLESVFDTLVIPDAELQMRPALAQSWEVSKDQLTWTFRLRSGVKWHDGTPFTAADVVYTYNRMLSGAEFSNAWKLSSVKSVTDPNDRTVVITVKAPTPNLLSNLGGFKGLGIVQKANVDAGQIARSPIGTGPFALAEYSSGDRIVLVTNQDYWGEVPKVGGVEFRFITEPTTALAALRASEADWTDSVPPHRVKELQRDDSLVVAVEPSSDYWYLALNQKRPPWQDVRLRQAIAYAIDRPAIVQAVSYGTARENQLAIPAGNPWYTEYRPYTRDLDRARSLFAAAGYNGGPLDLMATNEYPETVIAAQVIASNLEPLGIKVSIRQPDFSTWLDEQNSGNFDMLMLGWLGNIDPDDFYYAQHHSKGASNAQGYANAQVDQLLDAARTSTETSRRKDLYSQAAKIIADECSYIYLYNPAVIQAWTPKLSGYQARSDRAIRVASATVAE